MPIYPDVDDVDDTTDACPFIIDTLVINPEMVPNAKFKLKPILIESDTFYSVFFRKRSRHMTLSFLDSLLCRLKPKLNRLLHKYAVSSGNSIELTRELHGITISNKEHKYKAMNRSECRMNITNNSYVRMTVHLALESIGKQMEIEFLFKILNVSHIPFDADDLFL